MADRIRAGLHFADTYSVCRGISRRQVPMWKLLKRSNAETRWLCHGQRDNRNRQVIRNKGTDAKADTRGGSGVGARIGDAGHLSATIVWTCSVSPDTEQALRPQSPEVGTQAPGATCNMARRVCVPSLRSHRFQRFLI